MKQQNTHTQKKDKSESAHWSQRDTHRKYLSKKKKKKKKKKKNGTKKRAIDLLFSITPRQNLREDSMSGCWAGGSAALYQGQPTQENNDQMDWESWVERWEEKGMVNEVDE